MLLSYIIFIKCSLVCRMCFITAMLRPCSELPILFFFRFKYRTGKNFIRLNFVMLKKYTQNYHWPDLCHSPYYTCLVIIKLQCFVSLLWELTTNICFACSVCEHTCFSLLKPVLFAFLHLATSVLTLTFILALNLWFNKIFVHPPTAASKT